MTPNGTEEERQWLVAVLERANEMANAKQRTIFVCSSVAACPTSALPMMFDGNYEHLVTDAIAKDYCIAVQPRLMRQ